MHINKLLEENIDDFEAREGERSLLTGISTGFARLDQLTAGLQAANLITICGANSIGKRALAYNIARHAAINGNVNVSIWSKMLSPKEVAFRMICAESRVNSSRIKSGFLSRDDWHRLTNAAGMLSDAKIYIVNDIDEVKKDGLLIIDSFQMLKDKGEYGYDAVRELKRMSIDDDRPIIVLSSLNDRYINERSDKRPKLTDFRYFESAIADISDVVIAIYRDEIYNRDENNPNRGTAEVIILKHRSGPKGTAVLSFSETYTRFDDLTELE